MTESPQDIAVTDAALDALAGGTWPTGDDALLGALSAWRSDLLEPDSVADGLLAVGECVPSGEQLSGVRPSWRPGAKRRTARGAQTARAARASQRGLRRRAVGGVAAGLMIAFGIGGVAVAQTASPGSPLWPVTKVVYAERAASTLAEKDAESLMAQAQNAIVAGRPEDAQRHLVEAEEKLPKVTSGRTCKRLRDHMTELRGQAEDTQRRGRSEAVPAGPRTAGEVPAGPLRGTREPLPGGVDGKPGRDRGGKPGEDRDGKPGDRDGKPRGDRDERAGEPGRGIERKFDTPVEGRSGGDRAREAGAPGGERGNSPVTP